MAQEDPNVPTAKLDEHFGGSSCSSVVRLERMEDGKLGVPHLRYIRTCLRDMLSKIWSVDIIERQREGHQRDNSPASESVEEYENEIPNSHVNLVEHSSSCNDLVRINAMDSLLFLNTDNAKIEY
ncbi:hypothetical protein KR222_004449 [Zaprionus bogoriensis]|nr:hypothetical protein KR222_004449 [Zaprionus bogoriensis]